MSETIQSTATRVEDVPVKTKKVRRPSKKTLIAIGATAATLAAAAVVYVKGSKEDDVTILAPTDDAPELVLIDGISDLTA